MLKIQDNSLFFQVMFGPEVRLLHVFAFSLKCFSDQVADELASSRAEVEQLSACLSCLHDKNLAKPIRVSNWMAVKKRDAVYFAKQSFCNRLPGTDV